MNSTQNNNTQTDEQKKRRRIIITVAAIVAIILIILLLLRSCSDKKGSDVEIAGDNPPQVTDQLPMDEANLNEREVRDPEEIKAELDRQVAEGMMTISMNANPVFENGKAEGNLLITNDERNRHPQIIEIYYRGESRANGDTPIYRSGVIPVGGQVAKDKLDVELEKGEYDCIAYFYGVDDEGNILGAAAANIQIDIQA